MGFHLRPDARKTWEWEDKGKSGVASEPPKGRGYEVAGRNIECMTLANSLVPRLKTSGMYHTTLRRLAKGSQPYCTDGTAAAPGVPLEIFRANGLARSRR